MISFHLCVCARNGGLEFVCIWNIQICQLFLDEKKGCAFLQLTNKNAAHFCTSCCPSGKGSAQISSHQSIGAEPLPEGQHEVQKCAAFLFVSCKKAQPFFHQEKVGKFECSIYKKTLSLQRMWLSRDSLIYEEARRAYEGDKKGGRLSCFTRRVFLTYDAALSRQSPDLHPKRL